MQTMTIAIAFLLAASPLVAAETMPIGRFVPLSTFNPSPAWKAQHPEDTVILSFVDTQLGGAVTCGDISGVCAASRTVIKLPEEALQPSSAPTPKPVPTPSVAPTSPPRFPSRQRLQR